jgi:ribosomal protein S27AE
MGVVPLNRTLDQELLALMRGASLECPVCGEFVLHAGGGIFCSECGASFGAADESRLQLGLQAG